MTRAEIRRMDKEFNKKTKVFTLTQEQIDVMKEEAVDDATRKAFILMMALPLEVLISEEYWSKSAKKRLPKFMDSLLSLYQAYEGGNITMVDLQNDLWEYGGIRVDNK
jgi:hypothetical protein